MMAINFPAAAFLASLKSPSQNFLYCISQDTGAGPVVVYKDSQSINGPPWSNHENTYNHQQKEIPHEATQQSSSTNHSTIRVEAGSGNQVSPSRTESRIPESFNKRKFHLRSTQFKFPFHLSRTSPTRPNRPLIIPQHPRTTRHLDIFKFQVDKYTKYIIQKTIRTNRTHISRSQFLQALNSNFLRI